MSAIRKTIKVQNGEDMRSTIVEYMRMRYSRIKAAYMEQREHLSSRIGFLLLSAGCAIGIGNIYRFPIMTGVYGGGFFVLFYLLFLILLGLPVMTMELSVGRGSQASLYRCFEKLEKKGSKWHWWKYFSIGGCYMLMMCYTTISAWLLLYFFKYLKGDILELKSAEALSENFSQMVAKPGPQIIAVFAIIITGFGLCAVGLNKGVESVSKYLMSALLILVLGMGIYCVSTMSGAGEGMKFYLVPSAERLQKQGILETVTAAMNQAFFTLSLGIGCIAIFGSYIGRERTLLGESVAIISLDTFVALLSGFILFPACFTYNGGVDAGSDVGASFLFTTFASVFNNMKGGRIFGILFFLLLMMAAFSTVIAVFESIMGFWLEATKLGRVKSAVINAVLLCVFSLPAIFSNNIWSDITIGGNGFMDLEDKIVSMLLLPVGSIVFVLFCMSRYGWGFEKFLAEVNVGKGPKLKRCFRFYMTWILPLIVAGVLVIGIVQSFL